MLCKEVSKCDPQATEYFLEVLFVTPFTTALTFESAGKFRKCDNSHASNKALLSCVDVSNTVKIHWREPFRM